MLVKALPIIFFTKHVLSRVTGVINSITSDRSLVTVIQVSALVGCQANVSLECAVDQGKHVETLQVWPCETS